MMIHVSPKAFQMAQSLYPISIECRTGQDRANVMEYSFIEVASVYKQRASNMKRPRTLSAVLI